MYREEDEGEVEVIASVLEQFVAGAQVRLVANALERDQLAIPRRTCLWVDRSGSRARISCLGAGC